MVQMNNIDINTHFFNTFACISGNGFSFDEIVDVLLNEISLMREKGFNDNELEDALDYANEKSIDLLQIDLLDNFGKQLVERLLEGIAIDEYGNELPEDISCN